MNRALRTLPIPVAAAAVVLTVSGCASSTTGSGSTGITTSSSSSMSTMPGMSGGASSGSTSSTSSVHNDADVAFATDMIPHHAGAVQMADLALKHAKSAKVKSLAEQIKAAQDPEIRTMSRWLRSWGKPVPHTMTGETGMSGMSHSTAGTMSAQDITALAKAPETAFDRLFLRLMITHHRGAITMAKTELARGSYPQAKALAESISTGQHQEITAMRALLVTLTR